MVQKYFLLHECQTITDDFCYTNAWRASKQTLLAQMAYDTEPVNRDQSHTNASCNSTLSLDPWSIPAKDKTPRFIGAIHHLPRCVDTDAGPVSGSCFREQATPTRTQAPAPDTKHAATTSMRKSEFIASHQVFCILSTASPITEWSSSQKEKSETELAQSTSSAPSIQHQPLVGEFTHKAVVCRLQ